MRRNLCFDTVYVLIFIRDVFQEGDCDDGCVALAELLGWKVRLHHVLSLSNFAHLDCLSVG